MITMNDLEKSIRSAEADLALCRKRMQSVPVEKYRIRERNGNLSLFRIEGRGKDRKERYCSRKDTKLIAGAINKQYLPAVETALSAELDLLYRLEELLENREKFKAYESLPESAKKYITPLCVSIDDVGSAWEKDEFFGNSMPFPTDNQLLTDRGELVRSKAEMIIANLLLKLGLHYRYECRFDCGGKALYPDFTIMHPETGELYYLEYFGMMDNWDYAANALKKMNFYYSTSQADHFIFLFESERVGINIPAIENLLRRTFLDDSLL